MKPIQVENNFDCTVSVQVSETTIIDHTGTRKGLDDILILIEDESGDHIATFTPEQALKLIQAIHTCIEAVTIRQTHIF